ncbi:putative DNA-binding transcriptional regulator AlpA [Bradyrhizobium japonicum]|uniref:Uncharacterized protein n=1 Tax=Bradyrhizobium barranii subsp. barranii TaxID=2823807 RepID=A0A7Z0TUN9_9BRAD|nr:MULTISPECIES: hypothetical protein [Bradyrhizobium]UEM17026.1 hypothetical protein J4G43_024050 [Bradyrhizobium barranii subsp. barranii]UGX98739.1 hypothetical protein G6321_00027940 [Bradyrhizobium barranii subsp. barranii]
MGRPRKERLINYAPRGMRAPTAARYLDMSESSFLRLVSEGRFPSGIKIDGMVVWDRYDLDIAFENIKTRKRNTFAVALGLEPDDGPLPSVVELQEQAKRQRQAQRDRDEAARELKREIKRHREERRKPVGKKRGAPGTVK